MKKTLLRTACALLALAAVVVTGGAVYLLDYSLCPAGQKERDAASMDFLGRDYPAAAAWTDSMRAVGALRDTFVVNSGGLRLHALYAACSDAEGTAILVHGYTDNALRMMMFAPMYHDSLRFNVLLPDHAAHGQSQGNAIQMGWLDRLDTERWIAVADSLWPGRPVWLHGVSMGAATVMMCAGDSLPPSVSGVIEDCGYTSVWRQFAKELHGRFRLPVHPIMDVASLFCQLRYGWNFREASAVSQLCRSRLPVLFIHGSDDTFVPTAMVHELYAAHSGRKRLWIAPGSAHARSFFDHPAEYQQQVRSFIQEVENR